MDWDHFVKVADWFHRDGNGGKKEPVMNADCFLSDS